MTPVEQPAKKRFWTIYGVLVLFIVLAFLVSISGGGRGHASPAAAVIMESQISEACASYRIEYFRPPPTSENYRLMQILKGDNLRKKVFLTLNSQDVSPNGEAIDSWGTPFRITFDYDCNVHVLSAGPDKIFGTPDDITNQ